MPIGKIYNQVRPSQQQSKSAPAASAVPMKALEKHHSIRPSLPIGNDKKKEASKEGVIARYPNLSCPIIYSASPTLGSLKIDETSSF